MKKLIISAIVLIVAGATFGQSYQPFDFENGTWYCRYVTKGGQFGADFERTQYVTDSVKFYCNGDTVINNFVYKKLYYSGFSFIQNSDKKPISGFYTAIRNDTLNKRILFAPAGYDTVVSGTGIVLYNFNLSVGDSIGYNFNTNKKDLVTSIDSVMYCNRVHRRFNSESGWNTLIEGIGSVSGLFPVISPTDYGTLLCYQEAGNNDCAGCKIFTPDDNLAQTFWSKVIDDQHKNLSYITDEALFRDSVIVISGVVSDATCHYHNLFAFNLDGQKLWEVQGTQDLVYTDDNFIYTAGFTFIDDVGGHEQVIISKYNPNGEEIFSIGYPDVPHQSYYEFVPKSIDVSSDGKIIVSSEKSVVMADTSGTSIHEIQVDVQGTIQSVYSINPESYLITTQNTIFKTDQSFSTTDSVSFTGTIKKTLLQNDTVYTVVDTELFRIDLNLNIIDTLISNSFEIQNFDFFGEDLWFSSFDEGKINLTKLKGNETDAIVTFPKMLNETEFIVTDNSFVFAGNSFSNQIGLYSYPKNSISEQPTIPDIEFIDFNISNIKLAYYIFLGDSIVIGYFSTPEVIVKNNSADTIKSFAVFADLHGGMNCGQNFFYQKISGLEILPGQSQTVSLYRCYEEDVKNNELCFQLLAPNGEIETEIENNSICKTFTITATDKYKKPEITVYPNPCVDFLVIKNPAAEPLTTEIIDLNGKVLVKEHTCALNKTIDTKHIQPGLYILKIISDSSISTQTVIKQ
ncbi:MAG: T9SS type A sorting domain-containing protein [Draconibacterium sp.]